MQRNAYEFSFSIDGDYIKVIWTLVPELVGSLANPYPKLEMRFNYADISTDTVQAMLRDMEVPNRFSRAIMTRIAAPE